MKKRTIMIGLAGLLGLSIFGGTFGFASKSELVEAAGETACKTLDFSNPASRKNKAGKANDVNNYTSTWKSVGNEGDEYTIKNANNNNWDNWSYIKFGSEKNASIGEIVTPEFENKISKISITIDTITKNNVNNISLYLGDSTSAYGQFDLVKGTQSIDVSSPTSNLPYTIKFDCKKSSSNGFIQVSKVEFYEEVVSKNLTKIEISGDPTKKQYLDGEEFDPTGLTVTAIYDDDSAEDVTSSVTWAPSPLVAGNTTVTATYKEGEQSVSATYSGITVSKQEIEIMVISGELTKTQYFVGEEFSSEGLMVTGIDTSENEIDLTNKVTWSLSKFDKETTYTEVIATYVNEDGSIVTDTLSNIKIEVKEKTLEGIIVDASKMKLVYTREDTELDTTGLIVEACYPFDTYEDVTDKVTISKPDFTKAGEQTITVSFEGKEETFTITVNKYPETSYAYVIPGKKDGYYKVEQEQTDWSGKYLIAYCPDDTTAKVFSGVDAANGYVPASVSNSFIEKDDSLVSVSIEKYETGYAIKINGGENKGKYISGTAKKNALNFTDDASLCSISYSDSNEILIESNNTYLKFNDSSNNGMRFRFYQSGQNPIDFFKYVSNKNSAIASEKLLDAVYASIEELQKCNPSGIGSSYDWSFIANSFTDLDVSEKTILETAIANGEGNAIERFLEKYDYLVSYKGQTDFLNRKSAGQSNTNIVNPLKDGLNVSSIVASFIAISGLAIAITFAFERKRKTY